MWQNADYWAALWHEERRKSLYGPQRQRGQGWWISAPPFCRAKQ